VQAPQVDGSGGWKAWAAVSSGVTSQTLGGVLDFKPDKSDGYSSGVGQGKCNQLQSSELDRSFALTAEEPVPSGVEPIRFDALVLAEGEWSNTCERLGVSKSIDRFARAIGLVINLVHDPNEPATKDPKMRSFVFSPIDEVGKKLKGAGIAFEFG